MSSAPYKGIRLRYDDMIWDVRRMSALAKHFLQDESAGVLASLLDDIENIRTAAANVKQSLMIGVNPGVKTILSTRYRDSSKGQNISVYGSLSFVWEIMNWDKGKRKQVSFDLVGIASTSIRLLTETDDLVAHWQFEIGDATSPGCHFHSSANQECAEGLFPDWLKIPRLPGMMVSPMDGLEFLLGELFQSQWEQRISEDSQDRNGWAKSQTTRLSKLLTWQDRQVRDNILGTPWMSLKRAKPPIDVLSED